MRRRSGHACAKVALALVHNACGPRSVRAIWNDFAACGRAICSDDPGGCSYRDNMPGRATISARGPWACVGGCWRTCPGRRRWRNTSATLARTPAALLYLLLRGWRLRAVACTGRGGAVPCHRPRRCGCPTDSICSPRRSGPAAARRAAARCRRRQHLAALPCLSGAAVRESARCSHVWPLLMCADRCGTDGRRRASSAMAATAGGRSLLQRWLWRAGDPRRRVAYCTAAPAFLMPRLIGRRHRLGNTQEPAAARRADAHTAAPAARGSAAGVRLVQRCRGLLACHPSSIWPTACTRQPRRHRGGWACVACRHWCRPRARCHPLRPGAPHGCRRGGLPDALQSTWRLRLAAACAAAARPAVGCRADASLRARAGCRGLRRAGSWSARGAVSPSGDAIPPRSCRRPDARSCVAAAAALRLCGSAPDPGQQPATSIPARTWTVPAIADSRVHRRRASRRCCPSRIAGSRAPSRPGLHLGSLVFRQHCRRRACTAAAAAQDRRIRSAPCASADLEFRYFNLGPWAGCCHAAAPTYLALGRWAFPPTSPRRCAKGRRRVVLPRAPAAQMRSRRAYAGLRARWRYAPAPGRTYQAQRKATMAPCGRSRRRAALLPGQEGNR